MPFKSSDPLKCAPSNKSSTSIKATHRMAMPSKQDQLHANYIVHSGFNLPCGKAEQKCNMYNTQQCWIKVLCNKLLSTLVLKKQQQMKHLRPKCTERKT